MFAAEETRRMTSSAPWHDQAATPTDAEVQFEVPEKRVVAHIITNDLCQTKKRRGATATTNGDVLKAC